MAALGHYQIPLQPANRLQFAPQDALCQKYYQPSNEISFAEDDHLHVFIDFPLARYEPGPNAPSQLSSAENLKCANQPLQGEYTDKTHTQYPPGLQMDRRYLPTGLDVESLPFCFISLDGESPQRKLYENTMAVPHCIHDSTGSLCSECLANDDRAIQRAVYIHLCSEGWTDEELEAFDKRYNTYSPVSLQPPKKEGPYLKQDYGWQLWELQKLNRRLLMAKQWRT